MQDLDKQVQTRSEEHGILHHENIKNALIWADGDKTIWKISLCAANGERIRLVKTRDHNDKEVWIYEPIVLEKTGL